MRSKTQKYIFHPKKVHITKDEHAKAEKLVKGARFGKRWFPYSRSK